MLYSKKLISKFLPKFASLDDEKITTICYSIGTELASITKHPKLTNVHIGKLVSFENHPDSDHMHVCKVLVGTKEHTIVCGAQNLVAGKNVIVATEGCQLHDGRVIENKKLRGVMSEGMLCSYKELTPNNKYVSDYDDAGIIILNDNESTKTSSVAELLGLDDEILDIEIPFANRNDLNGVLSFCQEVAGYMK
jgi:phenylalanyl-tRNA synthetase beta chain